MSDQPIWYYAVQNERQGPCTWAQIVEAHLSGALRADTLVWAPHLPQWQALGTLLPPPAAIPPPPPLVAPPVEALAAAPPTQASVAPPPEEAEGKPNYIGLIVSLIVFLYNCYAITNNLSIGSGYVMVAIGVVINLFILVTFPATFASAFPRFNKYLSFAALGLCLIIGLGSGLASKGSLMEKSAVPVVTSILKEQLGDNAATCKAVTLGKEVSSGFWLATAHLSNGNDLGITIEDRGKEIYVTIRN